MDAESSVPDVQQLTKLAAMADQFSINNKDYIKMLGPVEQSCLWKTTILKGTPYSKFLSPPVDQCLSCGMPLQAKLRSRVDDNPEPTTFSSDINALTNLCTVHIMMQFIHQRRIRWPL